MTDDELRAFAQELTDAALHSCVTQSGQQKMLPLMAASAWEDVIRILIRVVERVKAA